MTYHCSSLYTSLFENIQSTTLGRFFQAMHRESSGFVKVLDLETNAMLSIFHNNNNINSSILTWVVTWTTGKHVWIFLKVLEVDLIGRSLMCPCKYIVITYIHRLGLGMGSHLYPKEDGWMASVFSFYLTWCRAFWLSIYSRVVICLKNFENLSSVVMFFLDRSGAAVA